MDSTKALPITEDDVWLLASAAENLRGGSQNEERRVEAAFRIASKLDDLRKRLDTALASQGEAAQPAADWRTMDSAPKDGEPVLFEYEGKDGCLYYCVSRWQGNHWRGYAGFNLTRWSRPFPASPGIASQAEEGSGE